MKKREPAGEGRNRRPKIRPLAASLLAAALVITALQIPGVAAKAVDLEAKCSLTVRPYGENSGFADDLKSDQVVIDLYKVADAEPVTGYDSYDYEISNAVYSEMGDSLKEENRRDLTSDGWRQLAQQAAAIALGDGSGADSQAPDVTGKAASVQIEDLDAGLYLIVARAADAEPGTYTTKKMAVPGQEQAEQQDVIATEIQTVSYTYTFLPELISLPNKEPDSEGNLNTANPGGWIYENVTATLKPSREERNGSLDITKTLASQSPLQRPATFVFQVDAYLDRDDGNGEQLVYSDVVGMTFTGVGDQTVRLAEKIPVGSRVVVTEVYSGASYTVSGSDTWTDTMTSAEEVLQAAFTNTGNDEHRDGSGVVNNFTYSEEGGEWQWSQNPGGTE